MLIAWCRPDNLNEHSLRVLEGVIDQNERQRAASFARQPDRAAFVSAHGILRLALSRLGSGQPGAWHFVRTAGGRPVLGGPSHQRLAFSLTHARTVVACAVVRAGFVGIDAEEIGLGEPDSALLAQTCSPDEAEALAARAPAERAQAFARLWTRKEAAAKALDLASNFQPHAFTFGVDGRLLPGSLVASESARTLTFTTIHADDRHIVTLASSVPPVETAIVHVDDEWVTFGPMRRDT